VHYVTVLRAIYRDKTIVVYRASELMRVKVPT
jgi:hypothetical protein